MLVFISVNGIRVWGLCRLECDIFVYCVGNSIVCVVCDIGFIKVYFVNGDVCKLGELFKCKFKF